MSNTQHKFVSSYYDPTPELNILAKEGWDVISHSSYLDDHNRAVHTILLKKDPPPYINRGPG